MHHFFEAITNTAGQSLIGYFARVINPTTQMQVTLASDDAGTPIQVVSGVANMAKTDEFGNLSLYVTPGTYNLDIYGPDATSFLYRVPNVAMNSSKGDPGDPGPPGPQGEGLDDVIAPTGSTLVGFRADGTGAANRTVKQKLAEQPSVADRGAFPGLTADQTAFIQLAIDLRAAAGGGDVYVPSGTYRVRDLRFKTSVNLIAQGAVTFKLFNPAISGYIAKALGQSDIQVHGITFDCTTEAGMEGSLGGVQVTSNGATISSRVNFYDCVFRNAQNVGWVEFRGGTTDSGAYDCQFYDHHYEAAGGTHGITFAEDAVGMHLVNCVTDHPSGSVTSSLSRGTVGIDRADVTIDRCDFRRSPLNAITIEDNALTRTQTVRITNTRFYRCGNTGLQTEGNGKIDLTMSDCEFVENVEVGMRLASGSAGSEFCGRFTNLRFLDNAKVPNVGILKSQLLVNIGEGRTASFDNCTFQTGITASGYIHAVLLNGEIKMLNPTFIGGSSGFGLYAPFDNAKAQERDTVWVTGATFFGVGTPTTGLPQFDGDTFAVGGAERRIITTTIVKQIATNTAVQFVDIETSTHGGNAGGGVMGVEVEAVVSQSINNPGVALGGYGLYHFTVARKNDGVGVFSVVNETAERTASGNPADRDISGMTLSVADVNGTGTYRARLFFRVDTVGATALSGVNVTFHVRVTNSTFLTSPVFA